MIKSVTIFLAQIVLMLLINCIGTDAQLRFAGTSVSVAYTMNNDNAIKFPNYPIKNLAFTQENLVNFDMNFFAEYNLVENFFTGLEIGFNKFNMRFKANEPITVIIDKQPLDGSILHLLDADINILYPSIYIGYGFGGLSFEVGNRFDFNIGSSYNTTQKIINPDSLNFINPKGSVDTALSFVKSPVYMPFVRIRYDVGKYIFDRNELTFQFDLEYSLAINSFARNTAIKPGIIKFGISVGFDFTSKDADNKILRDTVYYRDTVVAYSYDVDSVGTKLISVEKQTKEEQTNYVIRYRTEIREHYARDIRKPHALLNGELRTVFVSSDGEEKQECVLESSNLLINRHYPNNEGSKFTTERKSTNNVEIPIIRFYTSIISEAGLDSSKIRLYSSGKLLAEIVKTGEDWNYVDFNIDSLVNLDILQPLNYELILVDLEGQKIIAASGEILLKSKQTHTITTEDIYYIDLKFDSRTINRLIIKVQQNAKNKPMVCYYSEGVSESAYSQIQTIANKFPDVKFEKLNSELFRRRFFELKKKIENYLVFVVK